MSELLDLLAARSGTVCAVGAGGKKTTLFHLAANHRGRVGLTSTVPIAHFPNTLAAHVVVADAETIVAEVSKAAVDHRLVAFAHPDVKRGRYGGLREDILAEIRRATAFDVLYVKGDGARMRWIKAPADDEPLIPVDTNTLIPIISAKAIGQPLTEQIAHRPQHVAAVTGAHEGAMLQPEHVATLMVAENGALKRARDATVVPVLNMVDDAEIENVARETAQLALEMTRRFDRVVLTSSRRSGRLVASITR
jgi:probable selenium-dependent hydroxylase accessory protein YqeC